MHARGAGMRGADAPPAVWRLVRMREDARRRRDYADADRLRTAIVCTGYLVLDTPDGPEVRPAPGRRRPATDPVRTEAP